MPNEQNEEMAYQLEIQNASRLDKLEAMLHEHVEVCTRQKEQITELVDFVRNVNASLKIANVIRNGIVWVSGLIAAVYAMYHSIKGGGH